jgi:hypothetical protein
MFPLSIPVNMAETIFLLTKFVNQFSQDYETTEKFNKFLTLVLDNNINAFIESIDDNRQQYVKHAYNAVFHPSPVQPKSRLRPKPKRKAKSIYVKLSSPDKLPGDIIGDNLRYRNEGKLFWDGENAMPLSTEYDENGHVPPVADVCVGNVIQDALYWQDTIVYNHLVYACFEESGVSEITKCDYYFTFSFKGDTWLIVTDKIDTLYTPNYWNNIMYKEGKYTQLADKLSVKHSHVLLSLKKK